MNLAIVNQPLANRGDEAAHKALVRALAKAFPESNFDTLFLGLKKDAALRANIDKLRVNAPNVRYRVIRALRVDSNRLVSAHRIIKGTFLVNALPLSFLSPSLHNFKKALEAYDAVICAPGGICMGGFLNWRHVWILETALRLGKPVFYWGRSIGPFTDDDYAHSVFKKAAESLLRRFSFLSLRDCESVRIAKKSGACPVPVVDSAFLETPDADIPQSLQNAIGKSYVVFVPNHLTWHYRYREVPQERIDRFHLKIINLLFRRYPACTIVMLPQTCCSGISDYDYFLKLAARARATIQQYNNTCC